jgi:hypothetical protein
MIKSSICGFVISASFDKPPAAFQRFRLRFCSSPSKQLKGSLVVFLGRDQYSEDCLAKTEFDLTPM